jgi:hypothetical protein
MSHKYISYPRVAIADAWLRIVYKACKSHSLKLTFNFYDVLHKVSSSLLLDSHMNHRNISCLHALNVYVGLGILF